MPAKKKTSDTQSTSTSSASTEETFRVNGADAVSKVRELIQEGNVRKITVSNKQGKTLLVIPVTFGLIVTLFAPYLTVLGGIAALLTECTITVEREK